MKNINIEFLLKMTKSYLDGDMDEIEYGLDFPYEVELRYKDLLKEENKIDEIAELISNGSSNDNEKIIKLLESIQNEIKILNGQ